MATSKVPVPVPASVLTPFLVYTPDPTDETNPTDTGVKASTAAAEFRALKAYLKTGFTLPVNITGSGPAADTSTARIRLTNTVSARTATISLDDSQNLAIWNSQNNAAGAIRFINGTVPSAEIARFTAAGNLSLGVAAATVPAKLTVVGSALFTGTAPAVFFSLDVGGTTPGFIRYDTVGKTFDIVGAGTINDGFVRIFTAGTNPGNERLRIDTGGAFGIGGANFGTAGQLLTSAGPGASPTWSTYAPSAQLAFVPGSAAVPGIAFTNGLTTGMYSPSANALAWSISGAHAMHLDSSGNVVIGPTTGSSVLKLCVEGVIGAVGAASATIAFGTAVGSGQTPGYLVYTHAAKTLDIVAYGVTTDGILRLCAGGTTERLRVDPAGNIYMPAGSAAMTNGFFYIPSAAGVPSGVPAVTGAGKVPLYYDSTNNQLYVYNTAWKKVALA